MVQVFNYWLDYTYEVVVLLDKKWSHFLWLKVTEQCTQDKGPKLIHHVSPPHLMLPFHTRRKYQSHSSVTWCIVCGRHLCTASSQVKHKEQKQWGRCYVQRATQTPLQNRHHCSDRGHTALARTLGCAQEGSLLQAATHSRPSWWPGLCYSQAGWVMSFCLRQKNQSRADFWGYWSRFRAYHK